MPYRITIATALGRADFRRDNPRDVLDTLLELQHAGLKIVAIADDQRNQLTFKQLQLLALKSKKSPPKRA